MAHNHLKSHESIEHLAELKSLTTIDLQQNKLEDPRIVDVLAQLPDLRALYLMGNPVVRDIKYYRKRLISMIPSIKYIDDRPVFDDERRRAIAFMEGLEVSAEEAKAREKAEMAKIKQEKKEAEDRNFEAMQTMMREGLAVKKAREEAQKAAEALQEINSAQEGVQEGVLPPVPPPSDAVNPHSGEKILDVPETPALTEIREKRLEKLLQRGRRKLLLSLLDLHWVL